MVGTVISNSKKGDCGEHTEADVNDFKEHRIDNECRKETRMKRGTKGWELVAANCWKCGLRFE